MPCRVANAAAKDGTGTPRVLGVDSTGTVRRLRALHAVGWSWAALADRLGVRREVLYRLAHGKHPWVYPRTAEAITRLYDGLWNVTPTGVPATKARRAAERRGWLRPAAWDDDIDDPGAVSIEASPTRLTQEQRCLMAQRLIDLGMARKEACKRAGIADKTVRKIEEGAIAS